MALAQTRVRVLIVDDSAMVRQVLRQGLSRDPAIEVVGMAGSACQADELLHSLRPDVMTLDIEMPHMDGVTFLQRLMPKTPVPVVVISSATQEGAAVSLRAMEAGAVDVIAKPVLGLASGLPVIMDDICERVRAAAGARPARARAQAPGKARVLQHLRPELIAIGASTGGVQALGRLLELMPPDAPPILVVQHMPEGFTAAFAARLDATLALQVAEARDGDVLERGRVLIAPGGRRHATLVGRAPPWRVALCEGDPVCFSRPSVDVMFRSVARNAGRLASAALLTGMGKDGAAGLLEIRQAGGTTIAQDEESSVVWGMPAAAIELGAAARVLPLDEIAPALLTHTGGAIRRNLQEGSPR